MNSLALIIQIGIALTVLNVWTLRFNRETPYRGGNAKNMPEEFAVYGLSETFRKAVCILKICASGLLLLGIWYKESALWGATLLGILMAGAVVMHIKVGDPIKKALPASTILLLCLYLIANLIATYQ